MAEFVLGRYPPRLLITAHVHLLLVGFMLQMVMGVATWMFPHPGREGTRYRPELAFRWITSPGTTSRAGTSCSAPSRTSAAVCPAWVRRRWAACCER